MKRIKEETYTFLSADKKTSISVKEWIPENPSGVVQILHGMAEHKERYDEFARFLCESDYVVVAHDHLGHGESVQDESCRGFFADEDGWIKVVDDVENLRKIVSEKYSNLSYFMFGHSMGTFVLRSFLIRFPDAPINGVILSGTGQNPGLILKIGKSISKSEIKKNGIHYISEKLDSMAFGSYNKKISNPRTKFDWLSVDSENVDKYMADSLCGFTISAGMFYDMMSGIEFVGSKTNLKKMNHELPVLFLAGTDDPVGNYGKKVEQVASMFKKSGNADVAVKLYDGFRHEILNESQIKETVMNDIREWLCEKNN